MLSCERVAHHRPEARDATEKLYNRYDAKSIIMLCYHVSVLHITDLKLGMRQTNYAICQVNHYVMLSC